MANQLSICHVKSQMPKTGNNMLPIHIMSNNPENVELCDQTSSISCWAATPSNM